MMRKIHRVIAALFLLTLPPAAYASFTGNPESPSPLVYLPLFPLFVLIITGTYMLVRPWILTWRAKRSAKSSSKGA